MMKKFFCVVVAVAATIVMSSCSKETENAKFFRAVAENAAEGGKVAYTDGSLLWQAGDQIAIYDASHARAVYGLAAGVGTDTAEYAYATGATLASAPYSVVYPASCSQTFGQISLPEVQHTPDGSLQGLPMYAVSNDFDLKFYHTCGVVRFRVSASTTVKLSRIAVATNRNINGTGSVSGSGRSTRLEIGEGTKVTTLSCDAAQSISSPRDFYMYLPVGTYSTFRILMTAADGSVCSKSATSNIVVERGKITTITLSNLTFTAHRFSTTSATSVVFSPGNLQYIGSAASSYWKFADRQYDYFGTDFQNGTTSSNVDRDLFGWGTSGWNNGATYYNPWATDANGASYCQRSELTGSYVHADWGKHNAIRNGGNVSGQWRTLTKKEWDSILFERSASTVNGTPDARYAKCRIGGGRNGVIIFPDDYTHPAGVAQPSGINTATATYTVNQYTEAEWLQIEAAGAVFLPASGYRSGTTVSNVGEYGRYWSSTGYNSPMAYSMFLREDRLSANNIAKALGFSVRLVKD